MVTGAAQGVGAEIAAEVARAGAASLFLIDKGAELGDATAAKLSQICSQVSFHRADLSDAQSTMSAAQAAVTELGRIDSLVNAAGITNRASVLDGTPDLWDRIFAINARAPYLMMQGAITDMKNRRAAGSIVNIVSMNAYCGAPDLAIYAASKGALATLTKNAANAHLSDRIRVNGINMGWAATPSERRMQADTLGLGAGWEEKAAEGMPLGRLLTTAEVASLATFLLSDVSGLMSGALIDLEQHVSGAIP